MGLQFCLLAILLKSVGFKSTASLQDCSLHLLVLANGDEAGCYGEATVGMRDYFLHVEKLHDYMHFLFLTLVSSVLLEFL